MFRDNLIYIILGLVAVVLIGVTIGLQLVLMSSQSANNSGTLATGASEIITMAPPTVTPSAPSVTVATSDQPVAIATASPTTLPPTRDTPTVIPTVTPRAAAISTMQPVATAPPQAPAQRPPSGGQPLLEASGLTIASDEKIVVNIVKDDPHAIGFVGQRDYSAEPNALRALKIQLDDGNVIDPSPSAIFSGLYPLSRVLYIYSTVDNLRNNPDVAAFIGCYLSRVNDEILTIGYLPAQQSLIDASRSTYNSLMGNATLSASPTCTVDALSGTVYIAGNSTIAPLTQRMIDLFVAQGYAGDIRMGEAVSTGFTNLCSQATEHIIHSERPINASELADCRATGYDPVAFAIGEDALAVIVSTQNNFVDTVTMSQLQRLFSDAILWSDVAPEWPSELIHRAVPDRAGGTFATFVAGVFGNNDEVQPASVAVAPSTVLPLLPTATALSPITTNTLQPTTTPTEAVQPRVTDTPAPPVDYVFGYIDSRRECTLATQVVATLMTRWGWRVRTVEVASVSELFQRTAHDGDESTWFDLTLCYEDPSDRENFFDYASNVFLMGSGYAESANGRLYVLAHAGLPSTLEYEDRCIFELMKGLTFRDVALEGSDPESWIEANSELLEFWGSCQDHYGHSLHEHNLFEDRN